MRAYTAQHMYKDMFCVFLDCSLLSRFAKRVLVDEQRVSRGHVYKNMSDKHIFNELTLKGDLCCVVQQVTM